MSTAHREVNQFFHGPVDEGFGNSADYVVAHAFRQRQRGKNPSISYKGITNPKLALARAQIDIENRRFWGEPQRGSGRIAIARHHNATPEYVTGGQWLFGMVGIKYVPDESPHTLLRIEEVEADNGDGTFERTRPLLEGEALDLRGNLPNRLGERNARLMGRLFLLSVDETTHPAFARGPGSGFTVTVDHDSFQAFQVGSGKSS